MLLTSFDTALVEEEERIGGGSMRLMGGGGVTFHVSCGKQPLFPTTDAGFQVKRRMECGWVEADVYVIVIFFEKIIDNPHERSRNSAENSIENLENI